MANTTPPFKYVGDQRAHQKFDRNAVCRSCFRPLTACICKKVSQVNNKIGVIILQHPQEQYKILNSARLTHLVLKNSSIQVGLSWPNFKAVAGEQEQPSMWGILYLRGKEHSDKPVTIYNRKKQIIEKADALRLQGIVAIDGSWKQAKTLWWRNPWFTKLNRISLNPDHPSLRPQVKAEGLSTIEAVALTLENLGESPQISHQLLTYYHDLIIK